MHDIRALRDDPDAFDAAMHKRGIEPVAGGLLLLDTKCRQDLYQAQELQAERNRLSKKIGIFRSAGQDMSKEEQESVDIRDKIAVLEAKAAALKNEIDTTLASLPNILDKDVPPGADEASNRVEKQVGTPIPFDGKPREHFELGENLGLMDFERAARMSGSRFTILRGQLARLERALGQYMLDLHTGTHGYTEMQVPLLVNEAAFYGTNQLPKFRDDAFQTTDGRWLIPTSEVPLTNLVATEIVQVAELPMRFTALSECFRSEAGSAGRDTRGMLRQHQFRKVELVSITEPDKSEAEHERMTRCAEAVLDGLGLHYRRMLLCAGDTGFGAAKTYDLEVWLPGQGAWREISSCSNIHAFQARRMNARIRGADGKVAGFVHTLNGSGVATGRALIAVMETYQLPDGGIRVPDVLQPYMGGLERIG